MPALTGDALARALQEAYALDGRKMVVEYRGGGWFYTRAQMCPVGLSLRAADVRTTIAILQARHREAQAAAARRRGA